MIAPLTSSDLAFCSSPVAHTSLFDRLEPLAQAGFRGIAIQPSDVWSLEARGHTAQEIAARVADAGLVITEIDCTACWMPRQMRLEQLAGLTDYLRRLTADTVVETAARVGAQSVTAIDLSVEEAPLDEAAEGFARLCAMAAEHGLKAQIEFLPTGGIRSLARALAIVEAAGCDNGGLTIDAWHFFRCGSTLEELARVPTRRIHAVQLCDAQSQLMDDLWAELMTARLLPGEGALDVAGLVRTLDRIGANVPMGIEVFHARQADMTLREIAEQWAGTTADFLTRTRTCG